MYVVFAYIWLIFMVNVGKYTIHGSFGNGKKNNYQPNQLVSEFAGFLVAIITVPSINRVFSHRFFSHTKCVALTKVDFFINFAL